MTLIITCTNVWAGNKGNEKVKQKTATTGFEMVVTNANASTPNVCCADAGADKTITSCGGSTTIGRSPCDGTWCATPATYCPSTYSWAPAAGLSCTNCAKPTVSSCTGPGSTTYTLTTSGPNCATKTDIVTVTFSFTGSCCGRIGGAESEESENNVQAYSWGGVILVQFKEKEDNAEIEIYNINGALVKKVQSSFTDNEYINVAALSKGLYILKIISKNNQVVVTKRVMVD